MVFAGSDGRLKAHSIVEHDLASPRPTPAAGGTYILLVEVVSPTVIEIGKIGRHSFDGGCYAYVGSAFGPGGLAARLGRYFGGPKRKHWHIDSLLDRATIVGALYRADDKRRECAWAEWMRKKTTGSIPGFGSSDCRCTSHLFFLGNDEKAEEIVRAVGCELKAIYAIGGR